MVLLHIYLDESGEFRFGGGNDYVGGWICRADQEPEALRAAQESLVALRALCHEPAAHMCRIPNLPGEAGHDAYKRLFGAVEPFVQRVLRCDAPRGYYLGPTEAWHKAVVLAMAEVAKAFPRPQYDWRFFVSTRLQPVEYWLHGKVPVAPGQPKTPRTKAEMDRRDAYLVDLKNALLAEAADVTGHQLDAQCFHFLNPQHGDDFVRDELADAFCTAQREQRYFQPMGWKPDKFLLVRGKTLLPGERARMRGFLQEGGEPGEVLWYLLENDETAGELFEETLRCMGQSWTMFCAIVEKRLLLPLTVEGDRYQRLDDYRRLAECLPIEAAGAPARLEWLRLRALQKCDAHRGVFSTRWRDRLLDMLQTRGIELFSDALSRWQARLDVLLDDAQTRIVNELRLELADDTLSTELQAYRGLFPDATYDMNIAKLAGTLGQIAALRAGLGLGDTEALRQEAQTYFDLDAEHCRVPIDQSFALGYRTLNAFDRGDAALAEQCLEQEAVCVLEPLGSVAEDRRLRRSGWMRQALDSARADFFLVHALQVASLRALGASPEIKALAEALLRQEQSLGIYPRMQIVKWCALHLSWGNETERAKGLLRVALKGWDPAAPCCNAVEHIKASLYALLQEMEGGDGVRWWLGWAQDCLLPAQEHLRSFYARAMDSLPSGRLPRQKALACLLPFYFH